MAVKLARGGGVIEAAVIVVAVVVGAGKG